jgi:thiosulfate dehydrogenase
MKNNDASGLGYIIVTCCAFGAILVAIVLVVSRQNLLSRISVNPPSISTEAYGHSLVMQTAEMLGPDVKDPNLRYNGSRLNCASCHLDVGREPGTLTLLLATEHYPRFSARTGARADIEDRINECMVRSMNGRALPRNSPEMQAIAAYLRSLGGINQEMGESLRQAHEPPAFKTPNRAASPDAGQKVFTDHCAQCHGMNGLGLLATTDRQKGYVFPPLWGPDSFNDGAGMHRVLTAARFIKARMPIGKPDLTDDQAFDVAAYINSQPRPHMANLAADYPNRKTKPVDNGYGPFADSFPLKQHEYGPFAPIEAFYKAQKKGGQ